MQVLALSLAATIAVQVMASMLAVTGAVVAPIAAPEIGVAADQIGFAIAAMYAAAAGAASTCGGLVVRYGPIRVSQACLLLFAGGIAVIASGGAWTALAGHMLMGLGYGPVTPASSQLLQRLSPPGRRNLVFSVKQSGVPLGYMLAGAIVPGLALALGWRPALLLLALVATALAVALEALRGTFDADRLPESPRFNLRHLLETYRTVLGHPVYRRLAYVGFSYNAMQAVVTSFMVVYLTRGVGLDVVVAGALLSAAQTGAALSRLLLGALADRMTASRVLVAVGLAMSGCTLVACLFGPSWPLFAVAVVCTAWGAAAVGWNGVMVAEMARLAPPGAVASFTGGISVFTFAGMTLMPAAFSGTIGATGSFVVAFGVTTALALSGTWAMLWIARAPDAALARGAGAAH